PGAEAEVARVHHERSDAAAAFHGHHLGTARDHQILRARHDGIGGHGDAGDAGTAETVECDPAGADIVAGVERRHAPEIATLRSELCGGAPDDVVDIGGVDAGALGQRPQYGG